MCGNFFGFFLAIICIVISSFFSDLMSFHIVFRSSLPFTKKPIAKIIDDFPYNSVNMTQMPVRGAYALTSTCNALVRNSTVLCSLNYTPSESATLKLHPRPSFTHPKPLTAEFVPIGLFLGINGHFPEPPSSMFSSSTRCIMHEVCLLTPTYLAIF